MTITKDKFILKSKTIQGLVIMVIPMLASLVGFEWTGEDGADLNQLIDAGLTFLGFAWGFYGRMTATTDLKALP